MKPVRFERFAGINNRQPLDRLRTREDEARPVRDAVNVDLSASSTLQARWGYTKKLSGDSVRCLHGVSDGALFADGAKLYRYDGDEKVEVGSLASPTAHVAYTDTPLGTVWSDGYRLHIYKGTSRLLSPAAPNPEPVASVVAGGSLVGGNYGVFCTTIRSDGQQSAPTYPQYLTVPTNGAIVVSAAGHTERIAVFVTACDGEVFYRAGTIEVGQASIAIPLHHADGQPVSYEYITDMPAGEILGLHKGRLLSAVGQYLYFSMTWAMGLYRPATDFIPFPDPVRLVAPVEGGVYVATAKETYWLAGPDISKADMVRVKKFGAVQGTLTYDEMTPMWFTDDGPVAGSQDGQLQVLQDDAVAFPEATHGASIHREVNGLKQLISAISTNPAVPPGAAVAGSYMTAEVIQP